MQLIPVAGPSVIFHAGVVVGHSIVKKLKKNKFLIFGFLNILIVGTVSLFILSLAGVIIYACLVEQHSSINLINHYLAQAK
ncbi:MAG: hypothetical protein WC520_00610 [Candidatus Paceibacterota bacterium]